jgi:phosphatidylglycerol lysyltransferase
MLKMRTIRRTNKNIGGIHIEKAETTGEEDRRRSQFFLPIWRASTQLFSWRMTGDSQGVAVLGGLPLQPDHARVGGYGFVHPDSDALAASIIAAGSVAEAHLVGLGDKKLVFNDAGTAFIMYAQQGRRLVALFDPVGPQDTWPEMLDKFVRLAASKGAIPVFYQASQRFMLLAGQRGFAGYKLGELAEVNVERFSMGGGEWANLRRAINRAVRDGLEFAWVERQDIPKILSELADVSNAWLSEGNAREKQFSLGWFSPDYVLAHPSVVVRQEGRIIAFANVLCSGDRKHAFVDLMRFIPGAHRGSMDLLMVRLIETLKAKGYHSLNLGMAPLSGLLKGPGAPLWDKLGNAVFERGNRFYNFAGLRTFKQKFDPEWRSRFLAVPRKANPYLTVAATAVLIAGGLKGIFTR